MAYKVIILYQLYMPSYFLGTFTEYPYLPELELETVKRPDLLPEGWIYGVSRSGSNRFGSHESRRK